jgi:hypothetical protein
MPSYSEKSTVSNFREESEGSSFFSKVVTSIPHIPDDFNLIWSATLDLHLKYNKKPWEDLITCFRLLGHGPHRKDASNNCSIVACVFVAAVWTQNDRGIYEVRC